ncbi:hypothetical protein QQG74_09750 [Micromonospora sp. FIMYZ51]|uniref:hypothetical protein n=1 Tax=Micromonospora sp. FIMYZ51 TaxID=3051832 RepID=UPI003120484D
MTGRNKRRGRRSVHLLIAWTAVDRIEQTARDEDVVDRDGKPNRSEMMRIMLAYADRHRPKGWRP